MQNVCEQFGPEFNETFYRLYDQLRHQRFDPSLATLHHNVKTLLDARFSASQRLRLRVENGRVKSKNRLLLKSQLPKYRDRIAKPEDIFEVIRDIVGTRVTCNTINDAYAVVTEIKAVAQCLETSRTLVVPCADFEDDYIRAPKESGYRALSLLVGVPVAIGARTEHVTCEIQVRTLLQHAWGELTHEDTYKPEMKVPELIVILSKRLASALSVLDDIAQDIRVELDKLEIEPESTPPLQDSGPMLDGTVSSGEAPVTLPQPERKEMSQESASDTEPEQRRSEPPAIWNRIEGAFHRVFEKASEIEQGQDQILSNFEGVGALTEADVERAFVTLKSSLQALEPEYHPWSLTSPAKMRVAHLFFSNPSRGERMVRRWLKSAAENAKFEAAYQSGKELLGTVVHVSRDYALVQLAEGHTGILHAKSMKSRPWEYVDVTTVVLEGETVRVAVIRSDPATRRVELRLIRDASK